MFQSGEAFGEKIAGKNYQLRFLQEAGRIQETWDSNFGAEHSAICWMWIVAGVWALRPDWAQLELWCRRCREERVSSCPRATLAGKTCCLARIPAEALRPSTKSERPQPRELPTVLMVEKNDKIAASHERMVRESGFAIGASWTNYSSAARWLNSHHPDVAIIDVALQDRGCVEFAKKLTERAIPFLAVSHHSANTPGLHPIFQSAPWLEKPISSASLHLALRSLL
ncbi:MAG TPA: response regulator [Methylocella sp.]|nr:response regulator [Methylocella sp.]